MSCGVNPSRLMTKVIKDRNAPDFGALYLSYHLITRNHVPVVGANAELAPSSSTDNGGRAVQRGCGGGEGEVCACKPRGARWGGPRLDLDTARRVYGGKTSVLACQLRRQPFRNPSQGSQWCWRQV